MRKLGCHFLTKLRSNNNLKNVMDESIVVYDIFVVRQSNHFILNLGSVIFFLADYCCMTSLQRYLGGCGVVIIEEFEKIDFFKNGHHFFVVKLIKILLISQFFTNLFYNIDDIALEK